MVVLISSRTRILHMFFFLMIRRPPRSTLDRSSAASDVYKRQDISRMSHAHPTFTESLKEAALDATGKRALHI